MASLNKVFLMGNLTRDPELRYTAGGAAVASFGMAVNRKFKQGEEWKDDVCFVEITAWAKQAENCSDYLSKGSGVLVEGRLNFRTWENEEGQKRSKLDVVAINIQFLPKSGAQGLSDTVEGSTEVLKNAAPESVSAEQEPAQASSPDAEPKNDIPF